METPWGLFSFTFFLFRPELEKYTGDLFSGKLEGINKNDKIPCGKLT